MRMTAVGEGSKVAAAEALAREAVSLALPWISALDGRRSLLYFHANGTE